MPDDVRYFKFSVKDFVAEIILCRPDQLNSFTFGIMEQFCEVFESLALRDDVRAVVLGSEGRAFSAGGDFKFILSQNTSAAARSQSATVTRRYFNALIGCPFPIVAALQGDAIGAGATLALACDAIVCSRTAKIADPHVVAGLAAGDGAAVLWPQMAGLLRARRYLLTGDRLTGEEAFALGLVSDLVDTAEEALPAARDLAARIAKLPPLAVQATKKALVQGLRHRIAEVFELALTLEVETFASEDVVEAVGALRERRAPTYHGR